MVSIAFSRIFLLVLILALLFVVLTPEPVSCRSVSSRSSSSSRAAEAARAEAADDEDDEEEADAEDDEESEEEEEEEEEDDDEDVEVQPREFRWANTETTTLLWQMVNQNNLEGMRGILARDPNVIHERSEDGRGPLFWAYEYHGSDSPMVELCREAGADEDAEDREGNKPAAMQKFFNSKEL